MGAPKDSAAGVTSRITEYLSYGGPSNPELMSPEAVRELLVDARAVIERLLSYPVSNG